MQFALFYPTDAKQPLSLALQQGVENLSEYTTARIPTFLDAEASKNIYKNDMGEHIFVKISLPKPTKALFKINLRICFVSDMTSRYWGLNQDLIIPRDVNGEVILNKNNFTGTPGAIDDTGYNSQIAALQIALAGLFDPDGGARSLIGSHVQNMQCGDKATARVVKSAKEARARDIHLTKKASDAEAKHFETFNLVADGTPLVYRPGVHSRTWQLGVKRGTISKTAVKHVRLATPAEISSPELEAAGLSRHSALLLGAAAMKAVADHPDLIKFFKPTHGWHNSFAIDPSVPFHASFENPEEVKARRKDMEVIWMQTAFPHRHHSYSLNGTDVTYAAALMQGVTTSNPNFPTSVPSPIILSFKERASPYRSDDMLDLDRTCGIWTVSERLADLLRKHNLGASTLEPVLFIGLDNKHMANRFMLVLREDHASVIQARSPAALMKSLTTRGVKDYEIAVDPGRHGNLDLWFDGSVGNSNRQYPMFFSAKLMKAIKREKLSVRIGLKKGDTS